MKRFLCVFIVLISIVFILPFNAFAREPIDVVNHKHQWGDEFTKKSSKSPVPINGMLKHKLFHEIWQRCETDGCGKERKIGEGYDLVSCNKNKPITGSVRTEHDDTYHWTATQSGTSCSGCGRFMEWGKDKISKKAKHKYNKSGVILINGVNVHKTDAYCSCGKKNPKY